MFHSYHAFFLRIPNVYLSRGGEGGGGEGGGGGWGGGEGGGEGREGVPVHCCELKTRLLQEPCSTMPTEVVSTLSIH